MDELTSAAEKGVKSRSNLLVQVGSGREQGRSCDALNSSGTSLAFSSLWQLNRNKLLRMGKRINAFLQGTLHQTSQAEQPNGDEVDAGDRDGGDHRAKITVHLQPLQERTGAKNHSGGHD